MPKTRVYEIAQELNKTNKEVIEFLTAIMRGEETEQTLRLVGDGVQRIDDIEVSAKERIKAAELLGKTLQMFTDKVNVSGDMDYNIQIDYGGEDE